MAYLEGPSILGVHLIPPMLGPGAPEGPVRDGTGNIPAMYSLMAYLLQM